MDDIDDDDATSAKYLSYVCPVSSCRSHDARERGWLDPEDCKTHIAIMHRGNPEPETKRWGHPLSTYEAKGIGHIGPMRGASG